ncbi:hypothetical protein LCGC14_2569330, partial [marine sediment metagenome]
MQRTNSSLSLHIGEDGTITITQESKQKSTIRRCSSCHNLSDFTEDDHVIVLTSSGLQMRRAGEPNAKLHQHSSQSDLGNKLVRHEKIMHELGKQLERDRRCAENLNKTLQQLDLGGNDPKESEPAHTTEDRVLKKHSYSFDDRAQRKLKKPAHSVDDRAQRKL